MLKMLKKVAINDDYSMITSEFSMVQSIFVGHLAGFISVKFKATNFFS